MRHEIGFEERYVELSGFHITPSLGEHHEETPPDELEYLQIRDRWFHRLDKVHGLYDLLIGRFRYGFEIVNSMSHRLRLVEHIIRSFCRGCG